MIRLDQEKNGSEAGLGTIAARQGQPGPVEFKRVLVIELEIEVLMALEEHSSPITSVSISVPDEAADSVFRRADNRLAANVETGADHHRAASDRLETGNQGVIARVRLGMDRLIRAELSTLFRAASSPWHCRGFGAGITSSRRHTADRTASARMSARIAITTKAAPPMIVKIDAIPCTAIPVAATASSEPAPAGVLRSAP